MVLVRMKCECMGELWKLKCNFGDSACKLNAPIFAFKTGIAQYKIHGHILICNFSLLSMTENSRNKKT